ncbi:transcriptional regulator [Marinobacterium zhoushanense]|uniref:Transcriptional regulator n=1 Tax=Marinobacterium zhoushanense TaxID=1679163 RepID=A0ABQ1JYQ8_9GAMM|nr:LysR family transcriptional regulator [Marinobacterium zhoushanense]GGB82597.1 transcriptional regulator [Marinobacterium zhoushanense]
MLDDTFTLKKLEIFLAFMKAGTLADTAENLGMSTVSVHRAIHSLEEGLKCALFRQEGRLLVPLPSALVLEERVLSIVASLDDAVKVTRETAGIYSNKFKLGALYSLTLNTVPRLIAGMKLRKGDLNIELTLDSNEVLFRKLKSVELDAILVSLEPGFRDDDFTCLPLFNDEVLLAVPADSDLSDASPLDLSDFREQTFVTLKKGFATFRDSYRAFDRAGFEPNVVMEVSDIFSLISMVSAGVGYALLPRRVESVFENKIRLLPLKGMGDIRQNISMVCLANRERDPRILACIAECRTYSREL